MHLFPALALLRENHPDAVADFVVNPEFMPLLDFSPLPIRRRIGFERGKLGSWRGFLPGMRELLREIRDNPACTDAERLEAIKLLDKLTNA